MKTGSDPNGASLDPETAVDSLEGAAEPGRGDIAADGNGNLGDALGAALEQLAAMQFSSLQYAKIEFLMRAEQEVRLPLYLGSTLRGALGHALRKIACLPLCHDPGICILQERCAYAYCFETHLPRTSKFLRGLEHVPHPLVIEPPAERADESWLAGEDLCFSLILIGKAIEHFPYFVAAADKMAGYGLGKSRVRFRLVEVREARDAPIHGAAGGTGEILWSGPESSIQPVMVRSLAASIPSSSDQLELEFISPLRLIVGGKLLSVITFRDLSRALLSRLSSLLYFHCGRELNLVFGKVLEAAAEISVKEQDLQQKRLVRWSNSQQAAMRLDGLVGRIIFTGRHLPAFNWLIRAGELFHVGKGTVFGLGKYRIVSCGKVEKNE